MGFGIFEQRFGSLLMIYTVWSNVCERGSWASCKHAAVLNLQASGFSIFSTCWTCCRDLHHHWGLTPILDHKVWLTVSVPVQPKDGVVILKTVSGHNTTALPTLLKALALRFPFTVRLRSGAKLWETAYTGPFLIGFCFIPIRKWKYTVSDHIRYSMSI